MRIAWNAPTSQRARARDSKENVTTAARKGIPHGSVRKARKGKGDSHKGKGKGWSWGKGIWQVDGEEPQGDWKWDQEEEKPGSVHSVGNEKVNIIDQDGYELVKRPRRLGQFMAEIFAVEAEGPGDITPKELSKTRFCGEGCSKELCNRWSCKEKVRSCTGVASKSKVIGGVERVVKSEGRSQ